MSAFTTAQLAELESLRGPGPYRTVTAEAVVDFAVNPTTALHEHPKFGGWDMAKAARQQWLEAARDILQVWVTIVEDPKTKTESKMRETFARVVHGEHVYQKTKTVLLQDRGFLINSVLDRVVSTLKSYPIVEFDPLFALIERIRAEARAEEMRERRRREEAKRRAEEERKRQRGRGTMVAKRGGNGKEARI